MLGLIIKGDFSIGEDIEHEDVDFATSVDFGI